MSKPATTPLRRGNPNPISPRSNLFRSASRVDQGVLFLICPPVNRRSPPWGSLLGSPRCRARARPHCFSPSGSRLLVGIRSCSPKTSGVGRSLPQPRLSPLHRGEDRGRDRHRQRGGTQAPQGASARFRRATRSEAGSSWSPVRFQPRTPLKAGTLRLPVSPPFGNPPPDARGTRPVPSPTGPAPARSVGDAPLPTNGTALAEASTGNAPPAPRGRHHPVLHGTFPYPFRFQKQQHPNPLPTPNPLSGATPRPRPESDQPF